MHPKKMIGGLTAIALAVTGCGATSSSSSSTGARPSAQTAAQIRIYRVRLSGAAERPPGARNATGEAVIALHGSRELCWRFAHLRGFTGATQARIHVGVAGTSGTVLVALSSGPRLHHRGCLAVVPRQVRAIERNPPGYYVNILSSRNPTGAVRAQL